MWVQPRDNQHTTGFSIHPHMTLQVDRKSGTNDLGIFSVSGEKWNNGVIGTGMRGTSGTCSAMWRSSASQQANRVRRARFSAEQSSYRASRAPVVPFSSCTCSGRLATPAACNCAREHVEALREPVPVIRLHVTRVEHTLFRLVTRLLLTMAHLALVEGP